MRLVDLFRRHQPPEPAPPAADAEGEAVGEALPAGEGPTLGSTADDPVSRLERLQSLRARGVISDEQFEAQRREILDD